MASQVVNAVAKPRLLFHSAQDGPAPRVEGYLAQASQRRQDHHTFVIHRVDVTERLEVTESLTSVVVGDREIPARSMRPRNLVEVEGRPGTWLR